MTSASQVHHVGAATITRVDETCFALAPDRLFPAWTAEDGRALGERFATDTLDLANARVQLKTHLWLVEIDGMTLVVDTGIGNGKSRPFSALFDKLDNPVMKRLESAGFAREKIDYVLLTHLHVDHVGWNTHWQDGRWALGSRTRRTSSASANAIPFSCRKANRVVWCSRTACCR